MQAILVVMDVKKFGAKLFCLSVILNLIFGFSVSAQNLQPSTDSLQNYVYYLASSELKGRETCQLGQKLAAQYIQKSFKNTGLLPFEAESYCHSFVLKKKQANTVVVKNNDNVLFSPWHFIYTSATNKHDTIATQLQFVGFGTDDELTALPANKSALVLLAETPSDAFERIKHIQYKFGNTCFFVVLTHNSKAIDKVWYYEYQLLQHNLSQPFTSLNSRLKQYEWMHPTDSISIYYCFPNVLKSVFNCTDKELEQIATHNFNKNYNRLASNVQANITCITNFCDSVEVFNVENVGGYIRGIDTARTIVVSAHYDHVGETAEGINFGADDNASGTAALLEVARLMAMDAKNGIKPQTNVLFMAFSGEELGLLGSEALVTDTAFNLQQVMLNVNMDMIGRWDTLHEQNRNYVYLLTVGKGNKKLFALGKNYLNLPAGFNVLHSPSSKVKSIFMYGSDHYSFSKCHIPVAVFFIGLHADYHTPNDTPDKINFNNLSAITSMVYQYIYKAAEMHGLKK